MLRLLDALYGDRGGYAELRLMKDGKVDRAFFAWPAERDTIEIHAELFDDHDIYFGVLLRTRKGGKATDCEPNVHWLWADVDKKTGATFASLLSAPVPLPQVIVDSGHGWHLYWKLRKPVTQGLAQELMTNLALQLGGDMVGDAPRILRLPGTMNRKADPPLPVRILRMKDLKHGWRVGDFFRGSKPEDRRTYYRGYVGPGDPKFGLKKAVGSRSEALFRTALDGIKEGLSDDDIYKVMWMSEAGSKIREMTRAQGDRWVALTIRNARKRSD